MLLVLRRASAALLLGLLLFALPWGSAWADPDESLDHSVGSSASSAQATPAPTASPTPAPSNEPGPADTPSPEGNASPSASPSPEASAPATWSAAAEAVDVSFSVSPATIVVGETSTITVTLSNPSAEAVNDATVLVELPPHLSLNSVTPSGTSSGPTVSVPLGSLEPGSTETVTLIATGVDAGSTGSPVRFAVTLDDRTLDHELFIELSNPAAPALNLVQNSPLLVQVGDSGAFSTTLTNGTASVIEDVAVVARIASELDVVGIAQIPQADAIQVGSSPQGEDIVWIFESLEPGEKVRMTWTSRAAAPGDLEAANSVEALSNGTQLARSSQRTYLGFVEGVRTERGDSGSAPVVQRRVVTKLVPVSTEVSAATGGILPVTGWSPAGAVVAGLALIAAGGLLLLPGGLPRPSRLVLIALLLVGTACVSETNTAAPEKEATTEATPDPNPEPSGGSDGDEEEGDQVLGVRLERNEDADESETPVPTGDVGEVAPVEFETVTEVVSVVVEQELPVERLASREGDNNMSFTWGPGGSFTAASSVRYVPDATVQLLASLGDRGRGLFSEVSLFNLADDRQLEVDGRLLLEITSADGRSSTLTSEPIQVVLGPGGETSATLAFSLPPGDYTAKAAFLSD